MSYYRIRDLAEKYKLNYTELYHRFNRYGFSVSRDCLGEGLVSAEDAKPAILELEQFEDMYTTSDVSRILNLSESTIKRMKKANLLSSRPCKWCSRADTRSTQAEIEELIYRLDFAEPNWRRKEKKAQVIPLLEQTRDRFPGVDVMERKREIESRIFLDNL